MARNIYIPIANLQPFLKWLDFNSIDVAQLTDEELVDQWLLYCRIEIEGGEA